MRVLHVIAGAPESPATRFALESIAGLARLGVAQCLAMQEAPETLGLLEAAGVRWQQSRLLPLLAPLARRNLERLAVAFGAELLQGWTDASARYLPDLPLPKLLWLGRRPRGSCRRADYLIATDERLRRDLLLRGAEAHRAFVWPVFAGGQEGPEPRRADFGLPEGVPLLLLPSLPPPGSGSFEVVLSALAALKGVELALLGDATERQERGLKRLARAYGLADRLHLLKAPLASRQAMELVDLCLLGARQEFVAPVILDAWAARRPVVALRRPEVTALVQQARNGLLFEPGSPQDLLAKLRACLEEPVVARRLIAGGESSLRDFPERERGLSTLLRLYRSVAERGGAGSPVLVGAANVALMQNGVRRYLPALGLRKEEVADLLAIQLALGPRDPSHQETAGLLWAIHKGYRRLVTRRGRDFQVEIPSPLDRETIERHLDRAALLERLEQYRRFAELQPMAAHLPAEPRPKVA